MGRLKHLLIPEMRQIISRSGQSSSCACMYFFQLWDTINSLQRGEMLKVKVKIALFAGIH